MELKICPKCRRKTKRITKGVCHNCYRKFIWKRKKKVCKRCKKEKIIHAKGLCGGCYQTIFHLQYNKDRNYEKRHNISAEEYKKLTRRCVICGFDKIVELHHLDGNRKNNNRNNLIGLCPNHHKMFHTIKYKREILKELKKKGLVI